jgi:restriction system protein
VKWARVAGEIAQRRFVTTPKFSDAAKSLGRASPKQVALIDGEKLADFMARFDVDAKVQKTIVIKKLDEDFFEG